MVQCNSSVTCLVYLISWKQSNAFSQSNTSSMCCFVWTVQNLQTFSLLWCKTENTYTYFLTSGGEDHTCQHSRLHESLSIFNTFSCCTPHLQFFLLCSWFHSDINNWSVSVSLEICVTIPQLGLIDNTASYWRWCCTLMFSLNLMKIHGTKKWQSWVSLSYLMLTALRWDYCAHCAVDAETIYRQPDPEAAASGTKQPDLMWVCSLSSLRSVCSWKKWIKTGPKKKKSSRFHSTWWKIFFFINFCLPSHWPVLSSSRPLVLSLTVCRLQSWIIMSSSFLRSTWQWCLVNTHPLL